MNINQNQHGATIQNCSHRAICVQHMLIAACTRLACSGFDIVGKDEIRSGRGKNSRATRERTGWQFYASFSRVRPLCYFPFLLSERLEQGNRLAQGSFHIPYKTEKAKRRTELSILRFRGRLHKSLRPRLSINVRR